MNVRRRTICTAAAIGMATVIAGPGTGNAGASSVHMCLYSTVTATSGSPDVSKIVCAMRADNGDLTEENAMWMGRLSLYAPGSVTTIASLVDVGSDSRQNWGVWSVDTDVVGAYDVRRALMDQGNYDFVYVNSDGVTVTAGYFTDPPPPKGCAPHCPRS